MDHHLKEFYRQSSDGAPRSSFHSVIPLHKTPNITWEEIKAKAPDLSRGWFELSHLNANDRIEFSRDFWLTKLPYSPLLDESLSRFFGSLDDIGIFVTQKKFEDPYETHLVYSIRGDRGFFCGGPPASEKALVKLQLSFPNYILPNDYLTFLQIHNGFCKTTDSTGIIRAEDVPEIYQAFRKVQTDPILTSKGTFIDPTTLIPFYESFGMPFYQCFLADWYPDQEMGNVYYSGETKTISDIYSGSSGPETMAFTSFTDWLVFYLERIV
ncbi:MAG: SMI1/KNR4 family protein [Parachlamydiaceae bacterium]